MAHIGEIQSRNWHRWQSQRCWRGARAPPGPHRDPGRPFDRRVPRGEAEYRAAREELLRKEVELRRATEAVDRSAAVSCRRAAPSRTTTCSTARAAPAEVSLSQLFRPGLDSSRLQLHVHAPEMSSACPSCTSFLDAFDGAIEHVKRMSLSWPMRRSSASSPTRATAGERRLPLLRLPGAYNRDYLGVTDSGSPLPMLETSSGAARTESSGTSGARRCFSPDPIRTGPPPDGLDRPPVGPVRLPSGGARDFQPRLAYP